MAADIHGVSLAFSDTTLAPAPDWTRLDAPGVGVTVAGYTIDRGSVDETQITDGGTATVTLTDQSGYLDPTNTGSPVNGLIQPLIQAGIARWNPVAEEWDTRFRGFVRDFDYDFDASQQVNRLTLELVDIFEILNAIEMLPGMFGDPPDSASAGQVFFDNAQVGGSGGRIPQVMDNASIDGAFWVAFSGNVQLWETVYSPGETALTVCQEAADAEFPEVANFFPDRFGRAVFHGRLAQFDPAAVIATLTDPTDWDYHEWNAGDGTAVAASPSDTAHIREFAFNRGLGFVVNSAIATPLWKDAAGDPITATDLAAQIVQDTTSLGVYGYRSWTRQNLLTKSGILTGNDALGETKAFAQFQVDNKAAARNRITRMAFRPMRPGATGAAANHLLLGKIDISDSVTPFITSPGGGGWDGGETYFVRGVHEQVTGRLRDGVAAADEGYDNVTLSVDLIPRAWFDTDPFTPAS